MAPRGRGWPLAVQLLIWTSATSLLLTGLAVTILYWALADHFRRADCAYLTDKVEVVRGELGSGAASTLLRQAFVSDPLARVNSRLYLRLINADGAIELETPGFSRLLPPSAFPPPALDPHARASIGAHAAVGSDGEPYRIASASVHADHGLRILQLAVDNLQERQLLGTYRRWLIAVLVITGAGSIVLGYQVARGGLAPLARFSGMVNAISPETLTARIPIDRLPRELQALGASFNRTLARLEDAFTRLDRFSADIAHELRTPLHNIMGMVEVALQLPRTPAQYQETLSSCLEEFHRLVRLIDTLLFLARAEHPEAAISTQPVAIDQELQVLRAFYETAAEEAGVLLHLHCEPRLVVAGDRELIHRAIGNVVENALTYTERGGAISVDAARQGAFIRIRIGDTGRGIAAEHLPRIFDRFYRADPMRSHGGHSGLGLAMVRTIVHLHHGTVAVRSAPGEGTTVDLHFPILAADVSTTVPAVADRIVT